MPKSAFNIGNELNLYKCLTLQKSQEPERLYIFNEYENFTFAGKIPPLPNPPIFSLFCEGSFLYTFGTLFLDALTNLEIYISYQT